MKNNKLIKVGFLTAGGIAPCLSSSISMLIQEYLKLDNNFEFIGYLYGYKGLLQNKKIIIPNAINLEELKSFGGSFLGNSRVKLINKKDCIQKGYIHKNKDPLEVAANQLKDDKIEILHTIGGDDTNTTAGDLVDFLSKKHYKLTAVGLPKTIDNDVFPIKQTLGAFTAAENTAIFFDNIVNENTTSSRQLIIHEVMGRNCGWLTAYSAYLYREKLKLKKFIPEIFVDRNKWDIHAIYIPEIDIDINIESQRLNQVMDQYDCVNIFLSEGAGINNIVSDLESSGEEVRRDAFGHVRLDEVNPGQWYAEKIAQWTNAKKVLVQKSGYFARSAAPNKNDLALIDKTSKEAVNHALNQQSGVVALKDSNNQIECINFKEIEGGKPFNYNQEWFNDMLVKIGQGRLSKLAWRGVSAKRFSSLPT